MSAVAQQTLPGPPGVVQMTPQPGFILNPSVKDLARRAIAYLRAGLPVHLRGPAGCGKTAVAMHVANGLGRPVVMAVGDKQMTSADLIGAKSGYQVKRVVDKYVNTVTKTEENAVQNWQDHRLTVACREGFTFVYDEFTRSPPEANNVLLGILEERVLVLPAHNRREEYIKVHPKFSLLLTSNPVEYAGVHGVQDALSDRLITIDVDYHDRDTEVAITASRSGLGREFAERVVDFVRAYRDSGEYDQAPTLRACIMIGKVVMAEKLRLSQDEALFVHLCLDVLEAKNVLNAKDRARRDSHRAFLLDLIQRHFRE